LPNPAIKFAFRPKQCYNDSINGEDMRKKILNDRAMVQVYLSGETKKQLAQLAARKGICVSALLRNEITKILRNYGNTEQS
jgi:LDH2 family malate/lactate/ureidoglycolate dehydrogenase